LAAAAHVAAQESMTTYHNDSQRTGLNPHETILKLSNVNKSSFGKLFTQPVDGNVYTQPLYVPHLSIAGGTHNVVFICTEHDSVYAFDADSHREPLWHVSFLNAEARITTV
jgi:glucose dehydrogenase